MLKERFPIHSKITSSSSHEGKAVKAVAKVAALGIGAGVAGVAGITLRHHRELTHESIALAPGLQRAIDLEQLSLGVTEPYTWASVHENHHMFEDTTIFPFYRIYHAMKAAKERGIAVPETYKNLDRFVTAFDQKTTETIGEMADKHVRLRMGDAYKEPEFKDNKEIIATLNPTEPQYYYPPKMGVKKREDYTQDEIARLLLSDPHSPALVGGQNGVRGVALDGMTMYQEQANMFRAFPEYKSPRLQRPEDFDPSYKKKLKKRTKMAVAAGFVVPTVAMLAVNRDFSKKGFARAVAEGTAINAIRTGMEIMGGNVTNSAGHMGDPVQTELAQAFLNKKYTIKLKPDGTISTNTVGKGIMGRLASWATLDVVGGQQIHHKEPWKIAYTNANGMQAIIEAPWGSAIGFLASAEWFGAIKEGNQFNGGERSDVIHEAVRMIQDLRAAQFAREYPHGYPEESAKDTNFGSTLKGKIKTVFSRNKDK